MLRGLASCGVRLGLPLSLHWRARQEFFANDNLLERLEAMFGEQGSPHPTVIQAVGTIEVAFSPNNGVTETVVKAISEAQQTILVSAYGFTSKDIAEALLKGNNVALWLSSFWIKVKLVKIFFQYVFTNQGFDLRIDVKHAIYHDKVMIIDDKTVITGSFNFTKAAETKNAENLLVLKIIQN